MRYLYTRAMRVFKIKKIKKRRFGKDGNWNFRTWLAGAQNGPHNLENCGECPNSQKIYVEVFRCEVT